MATRILRLVVGGFAVIVGIMTFSCDRRHGTGPRNTGDVVGSILISLNPGHLHLPSPQAIDSALIVIDVRDSEDVGMPNVQVRVTNSPHIGHIMQPDLTDSLGHTTALFIADPGIYDTTRISAAVGNKTTSALLTISQVVSEIGSIVVTLQKEHVIAGGLDSSSINVTVLDTTGNPVRDGTAIYFSHTGPGFLASSWLGTVNGLVRNKITSPVNIPFRASPDSIFVSEFPGDTSIVADTAVIHFIPGPLYQLAFIYPESTITLIAGSGDTCSVILAATDISGNPVFVGTQILFRNNLRSSILIPQPLDTINGYAMDVYLVGEETGDDSLTAWVVNPQNLNDTIFTMRPVVFRCVAGGVATLELSTTDDSIPVGGSSTQIIATLLDAWGNPYQTPWGEDMVAFDITAGSGSFNPQSQVLNDTVGTNINSQAILLLYSGTRSGPVTIRACTVAMPPESVFVCDESSLVTITPGPPDRVTFSIDGPPERLSGGPAIYCVVAASVRDRYSNPVEYATPVHFDLIPADVGDIDVESYTGSGKPYHPDSTEGVAYTRVIYGCFSTFDTVGIITSVGDPIQLVDTSGYFSLPICEGRLSMYADPASLWTANDSCDCHQAQYYNCRDTSNITATLVCMDGCPVQGGIVRFEAQVAGSIIGQFIDTTDIRGQAYCRYMIRGCDIPCNDNGCSIETSVSAVLIQDRSITAAVNIVCSRPR